MEIYLNKSSKKNLLFFFFFSTIILFKKERKRKMILKELKIEAWSGDATNCYIVEDEKTKETWL